MVRRNHNPTSPVSQLNQQVKGDREFLAARAACLQQLSAQAALVGNEFLVRLVRYAAVHIDLNATICETDDGAQA